MLESKWCRRNDEKCRFSCFSDHCCFEPNVWKVCVWIVYESNLLRKFRDRISGDDFLERFFAALCPKIARHRGREFRSKAQILECRRFRSGRRVAIRRRTSPRPSRFSRRRAGALSTCTEHTCVHICLERTTLFTLNGVFLSIMGCLPTTPRPRTDFIERRSESDARSKMRSWRSISSNGSSDRFSIVTVYCFLNG